MERKPVSTGNQRLDPLMNRVLDGLFLHETLSLEVAEIYRAKLVRALAKPRDLSNVCPQFAEWLKTGDDALFPADRTGIELQQDPRLETMGCFNMACDMAMRIAYKAVHEYGEPEPSSLLYNSVWIPYFGKLLELILDAPEPQPPGTIKFEREDKGIYLAYNATGIYKGAIVKGWPAAGVKKTDWAVVLISLFRANKDPRASDPMNLYGELGKDVFTYPTLIAAKTAISNAVTI